MILLIKTKLFFTLMKFQIQWESFLVFKCQESSKFEFSYW